MSLPESWILTTVSELGNVVSGGTPSTKEPSYWNGEINWISPSDLTGYTNKFISKGAKSITKDGLKNSSAKIMPSGSIHFSSRAPIGYTAISASDMTTNQGFKSLVPATGVFNEYIYYYFKSAKQLAETLATGTTFKEISGSAFSKMPVPLAPFNEQHRIVVEIEELFSELDQGIDNLKTAQAQLKVYRQALLKHAFEGKLTAEWRAQNADKLESASALQQRIQHARQQSYQQQLAEWDASVKVWDENGCVVKKPSKPRKTTELDKPSTEHINRIWNVPNGWEWLQIGEFAFVTKLAGFEYTEYVRYSEKGDLPVIKAENAGPNGYRVTQYSYVQSDSVADLTRSHLSGGELLMVFVGAGTGNVAMVPSDKKFFLGPNVGMIRIESDEINPRYVEQFLRSPLGKDIALASVKAVAQPSISMGTIRQTPVALPTRAEQDEIIYQIETKLSQVDQLDQTITTSLQQAEALRQSILKKAFSGELVPQEPNDEPAAALLARIQAEKAAQSTKQGKLVKLRYE